jgi:hypothetical protein
VFGSVVWMAWSKHGFRPIRARVIYMLFYNSIYWFGETYEFLGKLELFKR